MTLETPAVMEQELTALKAMVEAKRAAEEEKAQGRK